MDIWGWLDNSDSVLFSSRTEFLPIGSFFLSCFLEKDKGRIADTLKNCRHSQSISGRSTRCAVDIHPWRSPHESTLSQHQHATFQQPGLRADCFISPLSKTTCFYFIHILEEDCKAKNIIKRHEKPINEIVPLLSDVFKKINAECRQAGITNSRSFQIYDRDFHLHLGFPLSSFSFLSGQPFPINTDGIFTGPFNLLDFLEENERKLLLTNIFVDHARVSSNRKFRVFHKLRHPSRPHNPPIISQLQSIYIVTVNYILVMCELYSDGSAGNHMNGDTPRCQGTSVPYRFSPHDAPSAMRDATTSSNPHPVVYYGSSTASRRRSQSADEGPAIPYIRKPSALTSAASSQVSPPASSHHHRLQDTAQRGSFSESSDSGSSVKSQRVCSSCGRGDSPEWRRGPSGLRDLCNACGLRYARSISKNAHTQKRRREGSFGEDADVMKFAAGPAHGASISTFEDRGMHHFTQTECVRQPTPYLPRYNESLDPPYIAPTHTYPQYSKHLPAPIEPTIRPPAVSMLKDHTFPKRKGMPASLANILTTDPMPNSDSSETESPTRTKEEVQLN